MIDKRPAGEMDELQAKLAEVKARADARRADALAVIEKKRIETEIAICDAEESEGLVRGVDCDVVFSPRDGSAILVRTPVEVVFQRFQAKLQAEKMQTSDLWDLVRACLVFPDRDTLNQIVAAAPGLLIQAANACAKLAGAQAEVQAGK